MKTTINRVLLTATLVLPSLAKADYYNDYQHSINHHSVKWVIDSFSSLKAACTSFIENHCASSGECSTMSANCTEAESHMGYMCSSWTIDPNYHGTPPIYNCDAWWYADITRCPSRTAYVSEVNACVPVVEETMDQPNSCPRFGDPIYPARGNQTVELSLNGLSGFPLSLIYDSRRSIARHVIGTGVSDTFRSEPVSIDIFGDFWSAPLFATVNPQLDNDLNLRGILIDQGAHRWQGFIAIGANQYASASTDKSLLLKGCAGCSASGWGLVDYATGSYEIFESAVGSDGLNLRMPKSKHRNAGGYINFLYDGATYGPNPGLPIAVVDNFGRKLALKYSSIAGRPRISEIKDPAGE